MDWTLVFIFSINFSIGLYCGLRIGVIARLKARTEAGCFNAESINDVLHIAGLQLSNTSREPFCNGGSLMQFRIQFLHYFYKGILFYANRLNACFARVYPPSRASSLLARLQRRPQFPEKTIFAAENHFIMLNKDVQEARDKKILIVEDEGDMCLLLNIILNGAGVQLDHVKTLTAAEAYLQGEEPAIVLLDNRLPDGLGVDFISVLKNKYPAVKIIMISGFDAAVRDVALENGADSFLQKPFTKDQLSQSVKNLMN